jgi:hypothetical protein
MRKQAVLWSCIALAISFAFVFPIALRGYAFASLLIPIAAFAFAVAIYASHITATWFSSVTWLLNGIVLAFFGFMVLFSGFSLATHQPLRFLGILVLLLSSLLNAIVLYPKSAKSVRNPSG